MVRTYKHKTERACTPADVMLRAAKQVKCEHKSIRGVARDFAIPLYVMCQLTPHVGHVGTLKLFFSK